MLDIVQIPLARRMWRLSKFFRIPLNDERMQDINMFDLEFYELSMIADDPKKLEQLKNHFYDDGFDEWVEEFELEQQLENDQISSSNNLDLPDEDDIRWAKEKQNLDNYDDLDTEFEDYEVSKPAEEISDWEEVE